MKNFKDYIVKNEISIKSAIERMNINSHKSILFVVDEKNLLIGSLSDGDIRRGLLKGFTIKDSIGKIIRKDPKYIIEGSFDLQKIKDFRSNDLKIVPIVNQNKKIISILNFNERISYLPVDSVIMAGGRGERLRPLTDKTPKPLLNIDGKPIINYVLDHLTFFGIEDIWISLNYLSDQITSHLKKSKIKNLNYLKESRPMGTIGSLSLINNLKHDTVLILNSDLICNIDYELFLTDFLEQKADIAVLTIPYNVSIPFAILEIEENEIKSFKEKPSYSYQSNGGVYFVKKEVIKLIPKDTFFNATDLIEKAINNNLKVISYPFSGYWLDIGRLEDFEKAQKEIKQVKFK